MNEKAKKMTIRIDSELHKLLHHYAIDHDTSIQALTIELYKQLLDQQEQE